MQHKHGSTQIPCSLLPLDVIEALQRREMKTTFNGFSARPLGLFLWLVGPSEDGPMSPFWAEPDRTMHKGLTTSCSPTASFPRNRESITQQFSLTAI